MRLKAAPLKGNLRLPGSKSLTQRYIMLSLHAGIPLELFHPSPSRDTQELLHALSLLGAKMNLSAGKLSFEPPDQAPTSVELHVGAGGTTGRFLAVYVAMQAGEFRLRMHNQLTQRPWQELVHALDALGKTCVFHRDTLHIKGPALKERKLHIPIQAQRTGQFVSAFLLAGPQLKEGSIIEIVGTSATDSYICLTQQLAARWGCHWERKGNAFHLVEKNIPTQIHAHCEGDWTLATPFMAHAVLHSPEGISLSPLSSTDIQPDKEIFGFFESLGAAQRVGATTVEVKQVEKVPYFSYDFSQVPDLALSMGVLGMLSSGAFLRGLSTLQHKESHRLDALRKIAEKIESKAMPSVGGDEIRIFPAFTWGRSVCIPCLEDHRVAMAASLTVHRQREVRILGAACVEKSYPSFWEDLRHLGLSVEM
ncbi:MAG: hypothetical protein ACUVRD_07615 [Bacteroidia bacterium]